MNPDRNPCWAEALAGEWEEVLAEQLEGLQTGEKGGEQEEAREETPGRITYPNQINSKIID